MRRKHLLLASCIISALLLTFTFHVSADENVEVDSGAASNSAPLLDSYFWDNYSLLPYIESDGSQYINTGIYGNSDYTYNLKFGNLAYTESFKSLFGSRLGYQQQAISISYNYDPYNNFYISFNNGAYEYQRQFNVYEIYDLKIDHEDVYFNGSLIHSFTYAQFDNQRPIYLFSLNDGSQDPSYLNSSYRLYSFSVSSDEDGYICYYYPAKSKSGDVIGLYDAISKTFVTTSGSVPFESPTDDQVIHFQIGNFITAGLGWIGDILEYAITEPIILFFMAIGLCGVAFRWARRVYHF